MTDQEILRSAIQKAAKNGYIPVQVGIIVSHPRMMGKNTLWDYYHRGIIFSHKFAKAFWSNENVDFGGGLTESEYKKAIENLPEDRRPHVRKWGSEGIQRRWRYNLQQMVLEPNPIKYLEKFL